MGRIHRRKGCRFQTGLLGVQPESRLEFDQSSCRKMPSPGLSGGCSTSRFVSAGEHQGSLRTPAVLSYPAPRLVSVLPPGSSGPRGGRVPAVGASVPASRRFFGIPRRRVNSSPAESTLSLRSKRGHQRALRGSPMTGAPPKLNRASSEALHVDDIREPG